MTAVALLHRDEILDHVRSGKILREIAPLYGVSKQSIHSVLKDDPEYRDAMKEQAAAMIEEGKAETWAAREPHDIARAREISRFAFRYAESVDTARWGAKTQVTVTHPPVLNILIVAPEQQSAVQHELPAIDGTDEQT